MAREARHGAFLDGAMAQVVVGTQRHVLVARCYALSRSGGGAAAITGHEPPLPGLSPQGCLRCATLGAHRYRLNPINLVDVCTLLLLISRRPLSGMSPQGCLRRATLDAHSYRLNPINLVDVCTLLLLISRRRPGQRRSVRRHAMMVASNLARRVGERQPAWAQRGGASLSTCALTRRACQPVGVCFSAGSLPAYLPWSPACYTSCMLA